MKPNKLLTVLLTAAVLGGCSSSNQVQSSTPGSGQSETTITLYSNAEVKDVTTGDGEKIGEYTVSEVESSAVNQESLTDYVFDYFVPGGYSYGRIIYADTSSPTKGVDISGGTVTVDVTLEKQDGEWEVIDSDGSTAYFIIDDEGKLMTLDEITESGSN